MFKSESVHLLLCRDLGILSAVITFLGKHVIDTADRYKIKITKADPYLHTPKEE